MECKQVLYKSYQCIFSDLNGCVAQGGQMARR